MALTSLVNSLNGFVVGMLFCAALVLLCLRLLAVKMDPREPPLVPSSIPYVGHAVGMFKHQFAYLPMLSGRNPLPAFTMNILSSKVYVVTHPALVQAAYRAKTLVFEPFIIEAADRMLSISDDGMKQIKHEPENEKEETYMRLIHKSMQETMLPGNSLLQMNARVLAKLADFVNGIGTEWEPKPMYLWLRDTFTLASSATLYGRNDPISADPSLIEPLWDFEHGLMSLYTKFMPWLTAPKAYNGRAAVQAAFRKYYAAGHDSDAGGLVKCRAEAGRRYGFSNDDLGDMELSIINVATTNALPSAFWLLSYILSDPVLLSEIRAEVLAIIETTTDATGRRSINFDIAKFNSDCPLLVSTYHESLRLTNSQVSGRYIAEDTLLTFPSTTGPIPTPSTYLLKKGNIIQLPSAVTHTSPAVWGPDAHLFDPRRFLPARKDALPKDLKKLQSQAFFPFGGGKHLCPGRYFALAEILGLVTMIVAGFEVVQVRPHGTGNGTAPMTVPDARKQRFGEGVKKPASDPRIVIRRRKEFGDVRWGFKVGECEGTGFEAFQKVH